MMKAKKLDNYIHYYIEQWEQYKNGNMGWAQSPEDVRTADFEMISNCNNTFENPS